MTWWMISSHGRKRGGLQAVNLFGLATDGGMEMENYYILHAAMSR